MVEVTPNLEVNNVRLLESRQREAGERVESARTKVDLALLKMAQVLEKVDEQTEHIKEELDERRAAG
jgi:hypothetical protein